MKRRAFCWVCAALLLILSLPASALGESVSGDFTYRLREDGKAVIVGYTGSQAELTIDWRLDGKMVAEIGPGAFSGNNALRAVTLPVTVQVIRAGAFQGCENLAKVELPSLLETIEDGAFWNCPALASLELPDSVAELGENCFDPATRLTGSAESLAAAYAKSSGLDYQPSLPEANAQSSASADYNYTIQNGAVTITSYKGRGGKVVVPAQIDGYPVRVIGESAFGSRYEVDTLVLPEGLTTIDRMAFRECTSMTEVTLPSTLQSIGDHAFNLCSNLEEIVLPDGLVSLGDRAFQGCTVLHRVTLPASLKSIRNYTFFECADSFIICAPAGSYAEDFAYRKGYHFVVTK